MHVQVGHKPRVGVDVYIGMTCRHSAGAVVYSGVGVIAIATQANRLPAASAGI